MDSARLPHVAAVAAATGLALVGFKLLFSGGAAARKRRPRGPVPTATEAFAKAQNDIRALRLSDDDKLALYGLYKVATAGQPDTFRPGLVDFVGRAKWDAWSAAAARCSPMEAQLAYVDMVERLQASDDGKGGEEPESRAMGPVMSRMAAEVLGSGEGGRADVASVMGAVGSGPEAIHLLREALGEAPSPLATERDGEGATPLHLAADRGNEPAALLLLDEHKAPVDARDEDGQTPLHYAVMCGQKPLAALLLARGADPDAKDADGRSPRDEDTDGVLERAGGAN